MPLGCTSLPRNRSQTNCGTARRACWLADIERASQELDTVEDAIHMEAENRSTSVFLDLLKKLKVLG